MDEIIPKMFVFVLFFAAFPAIAVEISNKNKRLFCKDILFHDTLFGVETPEKKINIGILCNIQTVRNEVLFKDYQPTSGLTVVLDIRNPDKGNSHH